MLLKTIRAGHGVVVGWAIALFLFAIPAWGVTNKGFMVVAAHPLAADAGYQILQQGGNAVDAAIAVQLVLNLVEPQSSGIGGGAFLLFWDAKKRHLSAYDGRETAPASAQPDRFLATTGKPLAFSEAITGGLPVGTPGILRMMELVHRRHGRQPWAALFQPAIYLAKTGFPLTKRSHRLLKRIRHILPGTPAGDYFLTLSGQPKAAGTRMINRPFALLLRGIAKSGANHFYRGTTAEDLVTAVRSAKPQPGDLTQADLRDYRALERPPICAKYRQHNICGMPPPTSGGIAVLQIMGLLERFPMHTLPPLSIPWVHRLTQASRLAFADRNRYVADPDFIPVPTEKLVDPDYLARRSAQIDPNQDMGLALPGHIPGMETSQWRDGHSLERPSTTHFSIVDGAGNAVSMTSSIEHAFGSGQMVHGFLLNNQLTDFSFVPEQNGQPVANAVAPRKRPRSSMAPMMVFDENGRLELVIGSPGGSRIIGYVAQALVAMLDGGLDPQVAAAQPKILNRNNHTELEEGTSAEKLGDPLKAIGHEVQVRPLTSGIHIIRITRNGLEGGADPRREGVVRANK